ncbi:MAG TPA: TonB-dependent receptor [Rhizomicrobium sp.]|nr:TonB-dependent receptor [Rhizomicrobium sp.]
MRFKGALAGSASVLAILSVSPSFAQSTTSNNSQPIETVTVTGLRYSEQRALDIKRQSDTIVDAIAAEDIGKLPDKNVADAIQRIPGVTTFSQSSGEGGFDENDRVAIRGTDPSLTLTTIDGHSVATGDWFILDQFQTVGRSVSYDLLPSEIVDSVQVHKSQQADMIEGGVAGTVDVITRKPLQFSDQLTLEGSAQAVYSDLPGKTQPTVNALFAWHDDSDHFGVLVQGFFEERDLRRDGQEFLGYNKITAAAEPALVANDPALNGVLYPTLIGQALFLQHRKREGGAATAEWRPTNDLDFVVSGFYSKLEAGDTNNNFLAWVQNEIASQNTPTSQTITNGTLVQANFPKLNSTPCSPTFTGCGAVVDGVVEDSISRPGEGASTWYVDADAKWNPTSDFNVHFKAGFTKGLGLTPTQPTWESDGMTGVNFNFANGGPASTAFPDINTANAAQMNDDWAWSDKFTADDQEFYTQADAEYEFNAGILQSIKFGARYDKHSRDVFGFDEGTCFFACPGTPSTAVWSGATYPSNFGSGLGAGAGFLTNIWYPNWSLVASQVLPHVTPYSPLANYWPGSFSVDEKVWAGYAMANLGGNKWKGNIGIRYVNTGENVSSYVADGNGTSTCATPGATPNNYGCYAQAVTNHTYIDPLPSANFSYDLTDDMVLRAAIARTMARPDYSALGGAVSLTDTILTGTGGNPNLKPVRAWTYQGSYEWYFAKASLLSVAAFYTDLTSDVDFGVSNATYLNATLTGQLGHPVLSSYAITSPINGSGTDKGVELAFNQALPYGFGFETNATVSDGEQSGGGALIGDSKYVYNLVGYWEGYGFSTRLAYTWRSKVLVGLDRSTAENEASTGTLALSASYDVTDNFSLTFDALNLNDPILKYYANNTSQPRAFYDNGRQFYFGVKFKY